MRGKLRNLSPPPLLNPPGGYVYTAPEMPPEDETLMLRHLEALRQEKGDRGFASHMLADMKAIGLPVKVAPGDAEDMERALKTFRDEGRTFGVGSILVTMKELGVKAEPTEEELAEMGGRLDGARKTGDGFNLAYYHYFLKKLGRPAAVTGADREAMLRQIDAYRTNGQATAYSIQPVIRAVGVDTEPTRRDYEIMLGRRENLRSEEHLRQELPSLYRDAYELAAQEAAKNRAPDRMPPLKRFQT